MTKRIWDTENVISYDTAALQPTWQMPVGPADTWEGFRVTVGQGVVVGIAWGMVATIAGAMASAWQGWPWWISPTAGLFAGALVSATHLTNGVSLRQSLLWKREELEQRDIDGDGAIGEPEPKTLRLELVEPGKKLTTWVDLGIPEEKARTFAAGVLATGAVTVARWTGRGGLLTRNEFETVRDELVRGGLLRWVGGTERRQLGVELTASGKTVLRKLAEAPSPTNGDG